MKRFVAVLGPILFAVMTVPATANAWTRIRNNHDHPVWVSHAFSSVSGVLCGWSDSCDYAGLGSWRVEGWWALAAGGETQIVHGSGYGNALHDIYAECDSGHVWQGGGHKFGIPQTAFSKCGDDALVTPAPPGITYRTFQVARGSRCCGGTCPANGTINLN